MDKVTQFDTKIIAEAESRLNDLASIEIEAANDAYQHKLKLIESEVNAKVQAQVRVNKKLANLNITFDKQQRAEERKQRLAAAKDDEKARKKELARQKKEDKQIKIAERAARAETNREIHKQQKEDMDAIFGKGKSMAERKQAWSEMTQGGNAFGKSMALMGAALTNALADFAKKLDTKVDQIAAKQSAIDTRLYGSKHAKGGLFGAGGYWDNINKTISQVAAVSPFVKQEDVVSNVEALVKKGIAFNVEQRAFLQTISDKIANTFNASDATLLRLIRIQQQDSTAYRLGMEAMLNEFLNNMYETTEYLTDLAANVRGSLEEAQALMNAAEATEMEFQLQKWLGSLYSVGMSSAGIQGIANAFGKVVAGDITGITGGGNGNLIVMAANQAGLPIADMLAEGLDASNTNKLMQAMVNYLAGIYDSASDSRVVQQQMASVFGLTASDLRAARGLRNNGLAGTSRLNATYGQFGANLTKMADSIWQRTSIGEMLSNSWSNLQYTMAAGIASNPVLYAINKVAGLLDDAVGGITFATPLVMGNGLPMTFKVADLMRVAAMSGGILSGLGSLFSASGGGFSGSGMLKTMGISGTSMVSRGTGNIGLTRKGLSTSGSGNTTVGQEDSSSIQDKTFADTADENKRKTVEAQESEDTDILRKDLNTNIIAIYELLSDVVNGTSALTVKNASGPWGLII